MLEALKEEEIVNKVGGRFISQRTQKSPKIQSMFLLPPTTTHTTVVITQQPKKISFKTLAEP